MFNELLAESDFPAQGYLFIVVLIFSFLKWLYTNLVNGSKGESPESEREGVLESLYEQYRGEIQRQQTKATPPPLTQQPIAQPPQVPTKPRYSQEDIERALNRVEKTSAETVEHPRKNLKVSPPMLSIKDQLRTKSSLRKALILREILDTPKALKQ